MVIYDAPSCLLSCEYWFISLTDHTACWWDLANEINWPKTICLGGWRSVIGSYHIEIIRFTQRSPSVFISVRIPIWGAIRGVKKGSNSLKCWGYYYLNDDRLVNTSEWCCKNKLDRCTGSLCLWEICNSIHHTVRLMTMPQMM